MSVVCDVCDAELPTPPIYPITVEHDANGLPYVPADYTAVYEHMKTQHPHLWVSKLAQEYDNWKAGKL